MIYPLTFPRAIKTERLGLNRRQSATESTWTYRQQTVHTASQWVLEWSWAQMTHANAERVSAFLLGLQGQIGSFTYYPRQSVKSGITGISLASTAFAYNRAMRASGWAANGATGLRLGQFVQLGEQLLRIVEAPAFADASGQVTISFEPELRVSYAGGTGVNFANPAGVFRLTSSDALPYTLDPDKLPEFGTIAAREVI